MNAPDPRTYPTRPFLAVSAAVIRDERFLLVRRARPPRLFTLPGGVVEVGETLIEAIKREVVEETALTIEPVGLAGYREAISHDSEGRVLRHFLVLPFAARWLSGEAALNDELSEAHWITPQELPGFKTTEGLDTVVAAAFSLLASARAG
jgi:ADP-ribose pyrophosphatase YjhB (NUDIX family)